MSSLAPPISDTKKLTNITKCYMNQDCSSEFLGTSGDYSTQFDTSILKCNYGDNYSDTDLIKQFNTDLYNAIFNTIYSNVGSTNEIAIKIAGEVFGQYAGIYLDTVDISDDVQNGIYLKSSFIADNGYSTGIYLEDSQMGHIAYDNTDIDYTPPIIQSDQGCTIQNEEYDPRCVCYYTS